MYVHFKHFDTHKELRHVEELRDHLYNAIPPGSLVLVATEDEARMRFGELGNGTAGPKPEAAQQVDDYFALLGATVTEVGYRGAFALAGFARGTASALVAGGFRWNRRGDNDAEPAVAELNALQIPIPHRVDLDHGGYGEDNNIIMDPSCKAPDVKADYVHEGCFLSYGWAKDATVLACSDPSYTTGKSLGLCRLDVAADRRVSTCACACHNIGFDHFALEDSSACFCGAGHATTQRVDGCSNGHGGSYRMDVYAYKQLGDAAESEPDTATSSTDRKPNMLAFATGAACAEVLEAANIRQTEIKVAEATSSSVGWCGFASKMIDGEHNNGIYGLNENTVCAHTDQTASWMKLDLGQSQAVRRIDFVGRKGYEDQGSGWTVRIGDTGDVTDKVCATNVTISGGTWKRVFCTVATKGRYVTAYSDTWMVLCEVKVFSEFSTPFGISSDNRSALGAGDRASSSALLRCAEEGDATFLTLDEDVCSPTVALLNAALKQRAAALALTTTVPTNTTPTAPTSSSAAHTTLRTNTTSIPSLPGATNASAGAMLPKRSGSAGRAAGIVCGVLCLGASVWAAVWLWKRKHEHRPPRQRVNRRAAQAEMEQQENNRNTIMMVENPLRASNPAQHRPPQQQQQQQPAPEYINVAMQGQPEHVNSDADSVVGGSDDVYYSTIGSGRDPSTPAEYAAPDETMMHSSSLYHGPANGAGVGLYATPADQDSLYQHPDGGTMYASSA